MLIEEDPTYVRPQQLGPLQPGKVHTIHRPEKSKKSSKPLAESPLSASRVFHFSEFLWQMGQGLNVVGLRIDAQELQQLGLKVAQLRVEPEIVAIGHREPVSLDWLQNIEDAAAGGALATSSLRVQGQ